MIPLHIPIKVLAAELITVLGGLPVLADRSFSIYDIDDLKDQSDYTGGPVVGVAYEGSTVVENAAHSATTKSPSGTILTKSFLIIIGVEYAAAGADQGQQPDQDTKDDAMDLMDATREALFGFKGVNLRPWRFAGESPIGGSESGMIWYGQRWETEVPLVGVHNR